VDDVPGSMPSLNGPKGAASRSACMAADYLLPKELSEGDRRGGPFEALVLDSIAQTANRRTGRPRQFAEVVLEPRVAGGKLEDQDWAT
jgi:hypothetical protein